MKRVLALVEGQTEETFFNDTIRPHLAGLGIGADCTRICTQREENRRIHRGGHCNQWAPIERDLRRLLASNPQVVTTMIDVYAFPRDMPGFPDPWPSTTAERVAALQAGFRAAINDPRFLPGLLVHEFEGLLFTDPGKVAEEVCLADDAERAAMALRSVRAAFATPEDIDDGRETAPSKRIESVLSRYQKPLHGPRIAKTIGLLGLRQACPHFHTWLEQLEAIGPLG